MLSQLTMVERKNQITPPTMPLSLNAEGRAIIPGPSVEISRLIVVDLIPPGLTSFFDPLTIVSLTLFYSSVSHKF
jgi:hypothetical protein